MSKKWRYSEELYLKLNYGHQTYAEMQGFIKRPVKQISSKAVRLGISKKRNWSKEEIALAKNGELPINRNYNSWKIKKHRINVQNNIQTQNTCIIH